MGCSLLPFPENIALFILLSYAGMDLIHLMGCTYRTQMKALGKLLSYLLSNLCLGPLYGFCCAISCHCYDVSWISFTYIYAYLTSIVFWIQLLPKIHAHCIAFSNLKPQPRCKFKPVNSSKAVTTSTSSSNWESESDSWPYWRYLHCMTEPTIEIFDTLCSNDDFWSLLQPNSWCQPLLSSKIAHAPVTQPLLFSVFGSDEKPVDLAQIFRASDQIRFQSIYHFKTDNGLPLIFDTGASITVTPHLSDFIDKRITLAHGMPTQLNGVNSTHAIKGVGSIRVLLYTDKGQPRYIETTGYYVPDINVRLLSVQRFIDEHPGEQCSFSLCDKGMIFTFPSSCGGGKLTFQYKHTNHLPVAETFLSSESPPLRSSRTIHVLDDSNANLSPGQRALLRLHVCLGHFNLQWIQSLLRKNMIPYRHSAIATQSDLAENCLCAACQFAKQSRTPTGVSRSTINPTKDGGLKDTHLRPGACVSVDQFVSSTPGRLAHTFGKERQEEKLMGGTVFVDHASGFVYVENQVALSAPETVRSKQRFERFAIQGGVPILGYHGDNGIFRSREFRSSLEESNQSIDFSGVGAHHQNGIAERAIRTISDSARAMLIHSMIHWPHETTLDLWPFAVEYAAYLYNHMPRRDCDKAPIELFFDSTCDVGAILADAKCWGCPAYVLDPTLQDGKKLPRWSPKSKLGQFLGRSREHADAVGRIRNLSTGAISSQFHVVYDNFFTTTLSDLSHDNIPVPYGFDDLLRFSTENLYHPDDIEALRRSRVAFRRSHFSDDSPPLQNQRESITLPSPQQLRERPSAPPEPPPYLREQPSPELREPVSAPSDRDVVPVDLESDDESVPPVHEPPSAPLARRSVRSTKGVPALRYDEEYGNAIPWCLSFYDSFLVETDLASKKDSLTRQFDTLHLWRLDLDDDSISLGTHPLAFGARANAEDTPRWNEAMKSPDREGFIQAMHSEWDQLVLMDAWTIVPRSKALSQGKRIIDSTWAFRRKRFPDGEVKKLKARLCVRGDQMVDLNPFDTYSPVVAWSTIRLMLIMSVILDLKTTQVDYTNAFVQAKASPGTFIEMPRLFERPGYVLELKRNLYGQRDAPIRFFEHLKEGLFQRRFTQSAHDRCLFISPHVIVLTYVDDCIFFSKSSSKIDKLIEDLRKPKNHAHITFTLNVESDYEGFLGIDIRPSKTENNALELLQLGLIDRIIAALNLSDSDVATRNEPAAATALGKDELSPPRKESWSYPSIIGMMLYLASNSRPDIAFAVHQCARFSHCARSPHEQAVKRIARYLKKTRERGLIMKPEIELNLSMYADADFAGLWNAESPHDPVSVKSRTGYIIYLSNVPVLWSSKLQTEIATSTMHAEYIALSSGMRELIPVRNVFHDVCNGLHIPIPSDTNVIKVYEDNEGALKLASSPISRVTPHSKHFAIKYHWFREKLDEYNISLLRIDTDRQKADIFTKGLVGKEFERKRLLLMGW